MTACSPWVDVVESMPSWESNSKWDYLPPGNSRSARPPPPDDIWPAKPPRKHLYIDDAYLLHPLACLQLGRSWEGSPPVYICCGWECLADEAKFIASRLTGDGVPVVFEEYEAMPHVAAMVLPDLEESRRNVRSWSAFIGAAVEDPARIGPSFTTIKVKTLEEVEIDPARLTPFSGDDVRRMARDRVGREGPVPEARLIL